MIDFFFDYETRSRADLKKEGSVKYAIDPSTEATLLTWAFGRTSPIKAWRKGQPIPQELLDVAHHPEKYHFIAHNIMFDFLVWTQVFSKLIFGLKAPKIENISDNMAMTSHFRVGASLDAAARILQLPFSKDKEGRRLMLRQCKPNSKGEWSELSATEWDQFEHYGKIDTKLLREIYYRIPHLPASERWAWEWTFKRNLRGLNIDMDLVHELSSIVEESTPKYIAEFEHITGYQVKINSPVRCKEYFQQFYPEIEDMQADTLRDLLLDTRYVPPHVRRALEIKDLAGSTSIAKIKTAINQNVNGRIYGILAYHHAQSKRWAARGIQVHNFPRVDESRPDKISFPLNIENLAGEIRNRRGTLQDPIGFCKNLLRRMFLPDAGKYFYCGDWSKIEPTVLFWLVGLDNIPDNWYEQMAAEIYSVPAHTIGKDSIERQLGKSAALGCGYSMGHKKFREDTFKKTGLQISEALSKQAVDAYRKKYDLIVNFWRNIEQSFRQAIHGVSSQLCNGKIHIQPMDKPHRGVQIRLPSGSHLYYHQACETPARTYLEFDDKGKPVFDENGKQSLIHEWQGIAYMSDEDGQPTLKKIYGGLLCENITSATARDIILPALYNLEHSGFEILNLVHDEMWGQGEAGRDAEFEKIMCINPSWTQGMKITAGMKNGIRYLK